MRRRAAALLLVSLLLAARGTAATADEPGPTEVVETLHAVLVKVASQAERLGYGSRLRALRSVVVETFALEPMARERLGSRWDGLDETQRKRLVETIARLTASTYATQYARTAKIAFQVAGEEAEAEGVRRVRAARVDEGGARHALVYRLQRVEGRWRIVNDVQDGQDPLPAERKAFEELWARGGFPSLVAGLDARLERAAAPPAAQTATQVVARLQDALLGAMREAKQLGYRGRYQRLESVIKETHYLAAIARLTVRRYWDQWSKAQQREFVDTFTRLSVANYASKFDGYSGERFARVEERSLGKSTVVRSVLTKADGEQIRFDYALRKVKGRWRILNITVDGVSDLSTKQAEYGAVVSSGGLPALLQKLRAQIRRYETGQ